MVEPLVSNIVQHNVSDPPECIVVSISCASVLEPLRGKFPYKPLMILPGSSHKVISTNRKATGRNADWLFISEEVTTSSFYFDDMSAALPRAKKPHKVCVLQDSLLEYTQHAEGEVRSILWYPHYFFQAKLNGLTVLDLPDQSLAYTGNVLFLRADLHDRIGKEMNYAMRDGWLELRAEPERIPNIVKSFLGKKDYLRYLYRTSGLHIYPTLTYENLKT